MYSDILDNPKIMRLPPLLFKQWVCLMALANKRAARGALPPISDIAYTLRLSDGVAQRAVCDLEERGLVDKLRDGTYVMHDWDDWQKESDNVTERVRRYREKRRNRGGNNKETLLQHSESVSVSYSASESVSGDDATQEQRGRSANRSAETEYTEVFETFWDKYPRKVNKQGAFRCWQAKLRAGVTVDELMLARDHYAAACRGKDEQYVLHGATFLGTNNRWRDFLKQSSHQGKAPSPDDDYLDRLITPAKGVDPI